ncbi:MAG: UTP--glucose-1-phosphate uridylyltransferase [Clostridia bacterium]|nr:UTP--glucose-1-phosphate uridylyltransferase [Clostridia bacterium]
MNYSETKKYLTEISQEQLLRFYDELSEDGKKKLLSQIENTDFSVVKNLENPENLSGKGEIAPITGLRLSDIAARRAEFYEIGKNAILQGKVGAVLLAGGQGTRLGFDGPKGAYNIGVTKPLYIFEQQVKNLLEVVNDVGMPVPLYIVTSEINHNATVDFWAEHNYFSYPKEYVKFFVQDTAPAATKDGKVLLSEKDSIALSPNGNGGWFSSMQKCGLLADVQARGVEWLNTYAVDNVLQRIADPVFIGATIACGCNCGAKVVCKAAPNEKVGVLCLEDGKPNIIEYYELTEEMANLRDEKGDLKYIYGVILNYLFNVKQCLRVMGEKIPVHVVEKKVPYINSDGAHVCPEAPNAYKFETLILDMVRLMDTCLPYEVEREKEFAPVQNATGTDSVESARELLRKNAIEL